MKNLLQFISTIIFFVFLGAPSVNGQNETSEKGLISLTGKINCIDPINGTLSAVVVYNLNKEHGTMTDSDGAYAIQMSKNDTIMFSTAEHKEVLFYFKNDDKFEDRWFTFHMETDDVWLSTAEILGSSNLNQFKREILELDVSSGSMSLDLPVVDKYAKMGPLHAPEIDLEGPLTYLNRKFRRHNNFKNKVN